MWCPADKSAPWERRHEESKLLSFRKNHYSLRDDARRSQESSKSLDSSLENKRRLAENARSSRNLAGHLVDLETPLTLDPTLGSYYMEISLGTPPQKFVVMADTGSDLAWLQCLPGQTYYNDTNGAFDPSKSSTYAKVSCASSACEFLNTTGFTCEYSSSALEGSECVYDYTYGIGDTNGTLAEETLYIGIDGGGTQSVPKFQFGCAHNATADSFGLADGLFGLARGEISFPSQLGQYYGNAFSYCLVNGSRTETETSPLIFGDDALSATATNGSRLQLQYTPMLNNTLGGIQSFYYVHLDNITVGGVAVAIPEIVFDITEITTEEFSQQSGGLIFDSGTTYTQLLSDAFDPLLETISTAITQYQPLDFNNSMELFGFELCYNATWESWAGEHGKAIPAVTFNFRNGAAFDLGAGNLWEAFTYPDVAPAVCMAIDRASAPAVNIVGNTQQTDHYIVYDLGKQQIGFSTAVC